MMRDIYFIGVLLISIGAVFNFIQVDDNINLNKQKYGRFNETERLELLQAAKNMFYFGYDNYMKYAYPEDELDPVDCEGRGHDHDDP